MLVCLCVCVCVCLSLCVCVSVSVSVHICAHTQAQKALEACKETLQAARTWDPITRDNVQSAAYELVSKHQGALQTNRYW